MSDPTDSPSPASLDVGDVLRSSFELARRHRHHWFAIALGCVLPGAILGVAQLALDRSRQSSMVGASLHDPVAVALMVAKFVAVPFLSGVTTLYVTRSALLALEGRPTTRSATLESMRGAWGRSLVVSFLSYVGSLLTFCLCLVPGCFFVAAYLVAVPASLAEECGFTDAFERAAELTRGRRGSVFLVYLLLTALILFAAIPLCVVYVAMAMQNLGSQGTPADHVASMNLQLALVAALAPVTFVGALGKAYAYAVVYARLRGVTFRVNAPEVANVFA